MSNTPSTVFTNIISYSRHGRQLYVQHDLEVAVVDFSNHMFTILLALFTTPK